MTPDGTLSILANSGASYVVDFLLDTAFAFTLAGAVETTGIQSCCPSHVSGGTWRVYLARDLPSRDQEVAFTTAAGRIMPTTSTSFLKSGILDAGLWHLEVSASSQASQTRSVAGSVASNFTLDLQPVPEPASMLLVARGIVGLLAKRRVRSRAGDRNLEEQPHA